MKKFIKYTAIIIGVALVSVLTREITGMLFDKSSEKDINTVLAETVPKINDQLPRMLQENMRLDSVSAANQEMHYYYTAVNLDLSEIDPNSPMLEKFKNNTGPILTENYCNNKKMEVLVKNDIKANYHYYDNNQSLFAEFQTLPKQCK